MRAWVMLSAVLALAACDAPMPSEALDATGPALAPERWFAGHTKSWGVFEDGVAPSRAFTTDAVGTPAGADGLTLSQDVHLSDGSAQHRTWQLRRLDAHRYESTAEPVVGVATGEARGRTFHWTYRYRLPPGDWLHTVRFEHWMYLSDDGTTLVNRFVVSKLGVTLARATEVFQHVPGA